MFSLDEYCVGLPDGREGKEWRGEGMIMEDQVKGLFHVRECRTKVSDVGFCYLRLISCGWYTKGDTFPVFPPPSPSQVSFLLGSILTVSPDPKEDSVSE